jgi:hypothetical protein
MLLFFLPLILSVAAVDADANHRVSRIEVHRDQIVTVKTSIGIATIIQVPDRPNSVVVGDQDSFKVEYLEQAITIKPIVPGARSNLYVYTDWKRYNVELVTGDQSSADYVVYLESPKPVKKTAAPNEAIKWTSFKNKLKNETLSLEVVRLGRPKSNLALIELLIKSTSDEKFSPEWIWLTQSGSVRPIHDFILSGVELNPRVQVKALIQIRSNDLDQSLPLKLEVRRKKLSYLTIPSLNSWKSL